MVRSPLNSAKGLQAQIESILMSVELDTLPVDYREIVRNIKRLAADARLEVRDYEYAETLAEQASNAKNARIYFERLQSNIIKASEANIFSAVDVAHTSALIQKIISDIS